MEVESVMQDRGLDRVIGSYVFDGCQSGSATASVDDEAEAHRDAA